MYRAGLLLAAVAVKPAAGERADKTEPVLRRPSELPVYPTSAAPTVGRRRGESVIFQKLEGSIGAVRVELEKGYNFVARQTDGITHYVDTAKAHTQATIDKLNEPQNTVRRGGAIALGGLAGLIFSVRGGFFKKLFYTSAGALSIASLCYPRQAEEQAKVALYESRKAFAVAYNFVKGVKPGDEQIAVPVANFPKSLRDVKYILLDLYDDAKETLFPEKK